MAFGKDCITAAQHELLSGGPGWVKSELFTVQATIPAGSPAYTRPQLMEGRAPKLELMIRSMLIERFKLAAHRETRDVSVFALTLAKKGPKLTPVEQGSCDPALPPFPVGGQTAGQKPPCMQGINVNQKSHFHVFGNAISLNVFCQLLSGGLDRPVIDRTGISGFFDIQLEAAVDGTIFQNFPLKADEPAASVFTAIQEQLGLKLDSVKEPVEAIVIDSAEKPQP
jgi:uncharacterized protein (TIGR03435 family)